MLKKYLPYILLAASALLLYFIKTNQRGEKAQKPVTEQTERITVPVVLPVDEKPDEVEGFNRNTDKLTFSKHAKCRMDCRKIDESEVKEILKNGKINHKKIQSDKRGKTYPVEGYTHDKQHVRIVFAPKDDGLVVVTVIDLELNGNVIVNNFPFINLYIYQTKKPLKFVTQTIEYSVMKIKSILAKPFAGYIHKQIKKGMETAEADQQTIFNQLIKVGAKTVFGKDHDFAGIKTHEDFVKQVPLRDYEAIKPYIEKIKQGTHNVLWKGQPIYFSKTSGTTSGVKYIPITKDSIPNHINTARNALLCYMSETGNTKFADGKLIFLSGSPVLERVGGIPTGRLSGIVNHHIPKYLRSNQLPSFTTNCIEEWEDKLDKIVDETINQNMTLISGIPPWMQMYFDRLTEKSGKKVGELFPNFNVMVQGGVNFEPYKAKLFESIGRQIDCIELFPASEGFFAFQDSQKEPGLLLNTNSGIFFEFVPAAEIFNENPTRLTLKDVKVGENYALIINSNAGLWGYNIGDTIKFVSTSPFRIVVTGRTKHFISAFGEHVISEEVEAALLQAAAEENIPITEFTVAPKISTDAGKSYHEWFIEFENTPADIKAFSKKVDDNLRKKNVYYDDLIGGKILQQLKISAVKKNGFIDYMKSIGKLGGQNKVPRLSNDRKIAEELEKFVN